MEFSGMVLMFLLGLRHGFDPDHIAIIDGISVRYTSTKPVLAKWTGTLFAIGHGSIVTTIAVMISKFSHSWNFSPAVWNILNWAPGLLLIFVGVLNLLTLKKKSHYHPQGWKLFFVPKKIKNSSHPFAIVVMGMLFAMVFDTNTQAAAWAYTATTELTISSALVLGLTFSCGMVITDTLNSRVLYSLMLKPAGNENVLNYRRTLGWIIVYVSLLVGGYKTLSNIAPSITLNESILTMTGIAFFAVMISFYAIVLLKNVKKTKNSINGN
jgi:high-affinity nickel-transport protein